MIDGRLDKVDKDDHIDAMIYGLVNWLKKNPYQELKFGTKENKMEPKSEIEKAFCKQFEADVHLAYQQMGTKLRSTVRSKGGVVGSSTTFQKVGKGTAGTKSRHGLVPVMNLNHEPIECVLTDYYAGDWVDALDELKINHDERRVVASAGAYALGRKTDELIINALDKATKEIKEEKTLKATVLEMVKALNENDVPDDGRRYCVVGVKQWNDLLGIEEFTSGDDSGQHGYTCRRWLGVNWILHNSLPLEKDRRTCFMYHSSAIGHASGQEVKTDISWQGERCAHFVSNSMSQGACLIDEAGVVKVRIKED